jgi:RecA/RadA recombinase
VERDRAAILQRVIAAFQRRWGTHALRIFGQPPANAVPVISAGFPNLDAALGIGGFPRGRLTELLGMATSGKTTIALRALALAQAQGDRVGYIDLPSTSVDWGSKVPSGSSRRGRPRRSPISRTSATGRGSRAA